MTPLEQKIIDKFDKKFNETDDNYWINADSEYSTNCVSPKDIKDFLLTSLQQVRKETIKEIIKLLKEYLDLNTDDMLGTVDYETFGIRVSELLQSLTEQLLVKNKI